MSCLVQEHADYLPSEALSKLVMRYYWCFVVVVVCKLLIFSTI